MKKRIQFKGKAKNLELKDDDPLKYFYGDLVHELKTGRTFIMDLSHFDENTKVKDVLVEVWPETVERYFENKQLDNYELGETCDNDLFNGIMKAPNQLVKTDYTFQNSIMQMTLSLKHKNYREDEEK